MIEDSGVKLLRIDMDEIAKALPGYEPGQADSFRKPATLLLSEVFGYALKKKISFIMDGTFGNAKARENIERSLKHSFLAKIVYVFQDPKLAWRFTIAREKIEHRAIKFDGFIEAYYKTIDNIKLIGEEFGDRITLDIAIKNPDNKVGRWERNVKMSEIDKILTIEYNKDKLIQYIKGA
ncbi:zeta toxin family protein [Candidatus Saccharibacteria bacterium]|nr:zeta toxin family protein [Candidatus Saccharibacteria bacterium]